jgi:hypothetical protein
VFLLILRTRHIEWIVQCPLIPMIAPIGLKWLFIYDCCTSMSQPNLGGSSHLFLTVFETLLNKSRCCVQLQLTVTKI